MARQRAAAATLSQRDDRMSEHSARELQERFGELRSAAHTLSGEERWQRLTTLLDDWPHEHLNHVVLPYLEAALAGDMSPRRAPDHWLHLAGDKCQLHPAVALARSLCVMHRCNLRYIELDALVNAPHMSKINALDLSWNELKDVWLTPIARSPYVKGLNALNLSYNHISHLGIEALLPRSTRLTQLRALHLDHNSILNVEALTNSRHLSQLHVLSLPENQLNAECATDLAYSPHLRQLKTLNLESNRIGPEGLRALAQSQNLAQLTSLNLKGTHIGDEGIAALAESPYLTQLHTLDLGYNKISDEGLMALARSRALTKLKTLNLGVNDISDEGAQALASSPTFTQLESLCLTYNKIHDEGAKALISSASLPQLTSLYLHPNPIGVDGARALASAPRLHQHFRDHWAGQVS